MFKAACRAPAARRTFGGAPAGRDGAASFPRSLHPLDTLRALEYMFYSYDTGMVAKGGPAGNGAPRGGGREGGREAGPRPCRNHH